MKRNISRGLNILLFFLLPILTTCSSAFPQPPTIYFYGLASDVASNLKGVPYDIPMMEETFLTLAHNTGKQIETLIRLERADRQDVPYAAGISKDVVLSDLHSILEKVSKYDIFIFYYTGHGILYDNKSSIVLSPSSDSVLYDLLDSSELYHILQKCQGTCIILLDTCFSGGFVDDQNEQLSIQMKDKVFTLTSSQKNQKSMDALSGRQNGHLTACLLEALGWDYMAPHNLHYSNIPSLDYKGACTKIPPAKRKSSSVLTISDIFTYVVTHDTYRLQIPETTDSPFDAVLFSWE